LDRHRTTEDLPTDADVVIVGSGLSGALLAYLLLKAKPSLRIVMLEAREVCSGASARNGGQVKTDVSEVASQFARTWTLG
jgi:glycine/D-amino acid oxidase-like deaminating enzyme